ELGECGACAVLVEGVPVLSCLALAVECEGRAIETVEGLAYGSKLHPLQASFADLGGAQCGYCTPGIMMTAKALLEKDPNPPGEHVGRTGKDFRVTFGILPVTQDQHPLAPERVRYVGDPVAAVIARDEQTAFEARDLIDVKYRPLKTISDPKEALATPEPRIQ